MASTQCLLQTQFPITPIEAATSSILEAFTGRITPQIPIPTTPLENVVLCRNLAAQIESRALAKLRRNAVRRPVLGQIIGPLLEEIAMACQCPACQTCNTNTLLPNPVVIPNMSAGSNNPNVIYLNSLANAQNVNLNQLKFSYY